MKIALIGDVNSLFIKQQAKTWQSMGLNVEIISYHTELDSFDNIIVRSSFYSEPKWFYFRGVALKKFLNYTESIIYFLFKKRYESAMSTAKNEKISFAHSLMSARSVARLIKTSDFDAVYIHDVFAFGFVSYLLRKTAIKKIVFPWGGDIFMYMHTSFAANIIVRKSIKYADFVCPTSKVAEKYIIDNFSIKKEGCVEGVSWGVDTQYLDSIIPNKEVYKKYSIPEDKIIVFNIRRFLPSWGSKQVFDAFLELAKKRDDLHFVLIGNSNSEEHFKEPKLNCSDNNVNDKFTIIEQNIDFKDFISILKISTIGTSFMIERDMRSFSIIQAFYCGSYPILSNQEEYHSFRELGLNYSLIEINSELLISEIENVLKRSKEVNEITIENSKAISVYEDSLKNQKYIISKIRRI